MAAPRSLLVLRDMSSCFIQERSGQRPRTRAMRMLVSEEDPMSAVAARDYGGPRTPLDYALLARFER